MHITRQTLSVPAQNSFIYISTIHLQRLEGRKFRLCHEFRLLINTAIQQQQQQQQQYSGAKVGTQKVRSLCVFSVLFPGVVLAHYILIRR